MGDSDGAGGAFTRAGLQKSKIRRGPVIDKEMGKAIDRGRAKKTLRLWTAEEVLGWLRKHVGEDFYKLYGDAFRNHEITGRTLYRLTDVKLLQLGISNASHRQELYAKIQSLVIKSELQSFKDKQKEVATHAPPSYAFTIASEINGRERGVQATFCSFRSTTEMTEIANTAADHGPESRVRCLAGAAAVAHQLAVVGGHSFQLLVDEVLLNLHFSPNAGKLCQLLDVNVPGNEDSNVFSNFAAYFEEFERRRNR